MEPGTSNPLLDLLRQRLPLYGYAAPSPEVLATLAWYLELVIAANQRTRLVGDAAPEVLVDRHLGESLYLGQLVALHQQHLVDLGSGAGFPGLGLALAYPGLTTTLVESTAKKAAFLQSAVEALGLAGRVRVENRFLERRPPLTGPLAAELVTVRALEKMEQLPAWLGRHLAAGARSALWVSEPLAERWGREHPDWSWSRFHRLPGARERGIVLAQPPDKIAKQLPNPGHCST